MLKPEYSNRFTLLNNPNANEATLTFYNITPVFNEKSTVVEGDEVFEVSKIVMNINNLKELQSVINKCLDQIS